MLVLEKFEVHKNFIQSKCPFEVSEKICEKIKAYSKYGCAKSVGLFAGRNFEPDLLMLVGLRPHFFPKVNARENTMTFYEVDNVHELHTGYGGIMEPDDSKKVVTTWAVGDIIFIPGKMFDYSGGRVGSGAGYYDRYIAGLSARPTLIGVCQSSQLTHRKLEQMATDVRMDAIITEHGIYEMGFEKELK